MTGYSGTPLATKLGIKAGMVMRAVHAPKDYLELLAPLPDGARLTTAARGKADIVHHFANRKSELTAALRSYRKQLGSEVPLWVSWPKKSAREIKVCAVSATRSGLKLVVRKELR